MNAYNQYDDCHTKYRQIVYLSEKKGESYEFIAKLTNYAVSTVRNYVRKFAHLLEEACEMFKYSRKKKEQKNGEERPQYPGIEFVCPDITTKDSEKFYLIRAFDANGKRIFSKVGTTIREMLTRMKEHLKAYKDLGVVKIVVDKVWDCGNLPAEGFESWFRAWYIRRWPTQFNTKDRFFDVDFDLEEAQRIFTQYENLPV